MAQYKPTATNATIISENAAGFAAPAARNRLVGVGDDLLPIRGTQPIDAPVTAVRSATGLHAIVAVWPAGVAETNPTGNASMQTRLRLGPCLRGKQVTVRGRLYFVQGQAEDFYRALLTRGAQP